MNREKASTSSAETLVVGDQKVAIKHKPNLEIVLQFFGTSITSEEKTITFFIRGIWRLQMLIACFIFASFWFTIFIIEVESQLQF